MKTARLKKMTYEYQDENLDINSLPEITHDDAKALLFKVKKLLESKGIVFYLAFGTLLGAIRDKDFIKKDLDVDVYSNEEELIFKNLQYLHDNGLVLIRYRKHRVFSFRIDGVMGAYIDIYVWGKPHDIWAVYCDHISYSYIPRRLLRGTKKIDFLGEQFNCVQNPEKLLEFWYGETWNIPIGKFEKKYTYNVASHYYWESVKEWVKLLIKGIMYKIGIGGFYHYLKMKYKS